VVRLPREPVWMVPVAAAFALPLDRMLTSGGGLIPPVSWVTLAFIAGAFAYRRKQKSDSPDRALTPVPPRTPAPGPVP
jgi:hypothetical protein